jgi:ribosomal protein S19
VESLRKEYIAFRDKVIPKLINKKLRLDIPEEDRNHLQFLKDTKRWHPYIMRHSSLDMFADDPNVNDHSLRRHAGWSKRSDMVEIYTSRRGSSIDNVMMALGVKLKNGKQKLSEELKEKMVGLVCPFCLISNIPGTQLCISCHKPVSLVSMNKLMEEAKEKEKKLELMQQDQQRMWDNMTVMQNMMDSILKQMQGVPQEKNSFPESKNIIIGLKRQQQTQETG